MRVGVRGDVDGAAVVRRLDLVGAGRGGSAPLPDTAANVGELDALPVREDCRDGLRERASGAHRPTLGYRVQPEDGMRVVMRAGGDGIPDVVVIAHRVSLT